MSPRYETHVPSPLGSLRLVTTDAGLCGLYFDDHAKPQAAPAERVDHHPLLDDARAQLDAYFTGQCTHFTLPLDPEGTEFQRQVWTALTEIPYGRTHSYAQLAAALGRPKAVRAVGHANGRNPLSILVPCHRVVGRDGSLTGYAGGLARKRWLLALETRAADHAQPEQGQSRPRA